MIEWRSIAVNPNYEVSNDGQVRRIAGGSGTQVGKILKSGKDKKGYSQVSLSQNGKQKTHKLHRLVAFAFLGDPPTPSHQIAHGDGNKTNNHISNLRWATPKENCADKIIHSRTNRGEKNRKSKLTEENVHEIRKLISEGHPTTEIAKMFGVHNASISMIKLGKSWSWLK